MYYADLSPVVGSEQGGIRPVLIIQNNVGNKYSPTVIIAYDQDEAGQKATLRAIDILLKEELKVKVLRLNHKDVKDPDEYIAKYGIGTVPLMLETVSIFRSFSLLANTP